MKNYANLHNNHAVSEIVGSVILLLIAVLSFSAIYLYVFPLPNYAADSNIDIQGSVSGKYAELLHVGGESIRSYQVFADGKLVQEGKTWKTGDTPLIFEMTKEKMQVRVVTKTDDGGTKIVFEGELQTDEQCDFDDPLISEDNTPSGGTTGDPFTFNVTILDETKVFVYANWSHGIKSANTTLHQVGTSSNYTGTIITDHDVEDLSYYIYVKDYWDNSNKTSLRNVTITDNDPPEITLNTIDHDNDLYNLSADITDNIQIQDASLNLTYPDGSVQELPLNNIDDTYYYTATLTISGEYTYYFKASDGVNFEVSESESFILSDGGTNLGPRQGSPTVYSSLDSNTAGEDLICRNGSSSDPENDYVTSIYTWFRNDESFAELYLPFNTNASDETRDYTDSENNGTINGANWTSAGRVGGSYEFFEAGNVIFCALPTVFSDISNNDFSVTTWAKSLDISENQNCIFEAYSDSNNFVQVFQYNSRIYAGVCVDSVKYVLKTDLLVSHTWYHIGLLWDSSETSMQLYINGLEYDSTGDESVFNSGNNQILSIGQKTDENSNWQGSIDEFYVYDHLVSEDHVYQQYLCSRDGSSDVSVIVSEETMVGDEWHCIVTPNDGHQDGDEKIGLEVTIQ